MQSKLKFKIQLRIKKSFETPSLTFFLVHRHTKKVDIFPNSVIDIDSLIGDGYISIALLYAVFAFANFFAPALVEAFGHKMALFVSSLTYLVYVVMYLYPYPVMNKLPKEHQSRLGFLV